MDEYAMRNMSSGFNNNLRVESRKERWDREDNDLSLRME